MASGGVLGKAALDCRRHRAEEDEPRPSPDSPLRARICLPYEGDDACSMAAVRTRGTFSIEARVSQWGNCSDDDRIRQCPTKGKRVNKANNSFCEDHKYVIARIIEKA